MKKYHFIIVNLTLSFIFNIGSAFKVKLVDDFMVRWRNEDLPIRYYIDEAGAPGCTGEFEAIERAHQTWEDETRSKMNFQYAGTITDKVPGVNDSTNICYWYEQNFPFNRAVVAVCYVWWSTTDGHIYDCDIAFNGEDFAWSTSGDIDKMDVENIACHEIGHNLLLLDLYRKTDSAKTMYGYVSRGEITKRTLEADDKDGIACLYPKITSVWSRLADIPPGPKGKMVGAGSSVTTAANSIFALKGNNTNEFYQYLVDSNYWQGLPVVPFAENRKKRVRAGGGLCSDGERTIYAIKGTRSLEFWSYDLSENKWQQKPNLPFSGKKKPGSGSSLVWVEKGDSEFVFALKGNKTLDFGAYSTKHNCWLLKASVPPGPESTGIGAGSCITYDNDNYIYCLKAGTNEFYAYDIIGDSWLVKTPLPNYDPAGKRKVVRNGASIVSAGENRIFALRGGKSRELFCYDCATNNWTFLNPIPDVSKRKTSTRGAALVFLDGKIYALRRNKTLEFWQMTTSETTNTAHNNKRDYYRFEVDGAGKNFDKLILVNPNPFRREIKIVLNYELNFNNEQELKIYNAAGKLATSLRSHTLNHKTQGTSHCFIWDGKDHKGRNCAPGVYLIQLANTNYCITQKIIKLR
jgi:N-acetylneuraminic acid mutarotase